jgi:hypothetical protein
MRRKLLLLPLVSLLVGCSRDDAASLSRDYRNLNNEAIDALMMTTNEFRARHGNEKILKPYQDRLGNLDKRFDQWVLGAEDKLVPGEVLRSEGVATLMGEREFNKKRLANELARIQKLLDARVEREKEVMRGQGIADPKVDARKFWPNLWEISSGASTQTLQRTLDKGTKFDELLVKFRTDKGWQNLLPPDFKELTQEFEGKVKLLAGQ